jgi:hypothetical protein
VTGTQDEHHDIDAQLRAHARRLIAEGYEQSLRERTVMRSSASWQRGGLGGALIGLLALVIFVSVLRSASGVGLGAGAVRPTGSAAPTTSVGLGSPVAASESAELTQATTPSPSLQLSECSTSQLHASAGREGANGVVNVEVQLANVGSGACWLPSVPTGIALVRSDDSSLPLLVKPPVGQPGQKITLAASSAPDGVVLAYWANWCGEAPGTLRVVVTLDGPGRVLRVPFGGSLLPRCDDASQKSWIQLDSIVPE